MSNVEEVALWIGLFASIVSVVLAVVAIWFTLAIDRRSRAVTEQMIRSLQKIESTVERSADDTVGLIKVAWDRLLGSVRSTDVASPSDEEAIKNIAAGVTAELRAELRAKLEGDETPGPAAKDALAQKIDTLTTRLEETLRAQAASGDPDPMARVVRALESTSPVGRELAAQLLAGGHLTRDQYVKLGETGIGDALHSLRAKGLIGPARGRSADGSIEPVYWFRPGVYRFVKAALTLVGYEAGSEAEDVREILSRVGYPQPWLPDLRRESE